MSATRPLGSRTNTVEHGEKSKAAHALALVASLPAGADANRACSASAGLNATIWVATDPINAAIVAPVIDRLSRQYPRMTFHVVAGVPAPLRQELAARHVDFVIARFARPVGEEYSEEILFPVALVVVSGPNNPLTRRRKIELAELLSQPWVLDPLNTDFGAMQAGVFRAVGLDPPRLTVAAPSMTLRDELLATGRFLTVVVGFSLLLPRKHPGLKALPVKLPSPRQPVGITTLKNRSLSPVAQMFIESVRELVKPLANRR